MHALTVQHEVVTRFLQSDEGKYLTQAVIQEREDARRELLERKADRRAEAMRALKPLNEAICAHQADVDRLRYELATAERGLSALNASVRRVRAELTAGEGIINRRLADTANPALSAFVAELRELERTLIADPVHVRDVVAPTVHGGIRVVGRHTDAKSRARTLHEIRAAIADADARKQDAEQSDAVVLAWIRERRKAIPRPDVEYFQ